MAQVDFRMNHEREPVFSPNNFIEYRPGDINIILSAPHGGDLKPACIPPRKAGAFIEGQCVYRHDAGKKDPIHCKVVQKKDRLTKELTLALAEKIYMSTHRRPHVVINHLNRSCLDANRDIDIGAFGVPEAEEAWHAYHAFIEQALSETTSLGLFIDIHGQGHPENWIEVGYGLTGNMLDLRKFTAEQSTIANIVKYNKHLSSEGFEDLISGACSFGGLLTSAGYKAVPSPSHPGPDGGQYFTGGFNVKKYGSHPKCAAIQLESPRLLRYVDTIPEYACDLANVIINYYKMYFDANV